MLQTGVFVANGKERGVSKGGLMGRTGWLDVFLIPKMAVSCFFVITGCLGQEAAAFLCYPKIAGWLLAILSSVLGSRVFCGGFYWNLYLCLKVITKISMKAETQFQKLKICSTPSSSKAVSAIFSGHIYSFFPSVCHIGNQHYILILSALLYLLYGNF